MYNFFANFEFMNQLFSSFSQDKIEAGCDEAGRGCLAGPVVAAAVILPKDFKHPDLNDSKKMTDKSRKILRLIIEKEAIAFGVCSIDNNKIDEINILNASILAMQHAVSELKIKPELLLIDGNRFHKYEDTPHHCIVKGDSLYYSIAAASVLAKTYRDDIMSHLHESYPNYGWNVNKGYPTKLHREALQKNGTTPYHRLTFNLLGDSQLNLFD
jgi:ribonuclease HII